MPLSSGDRLGHYDVSALIGEGGMGQVWHGHDTELKRDVALKILPVHFAADEDRLARFRREAQVLASLNHPGIAAIYGIAEAEETRALVLELVEGPTLAERIAGGPLPLGEALPIAQQIAEALEAAHEAGVIHRDLKPANIKVREDGTVKVLDFGLAKALDPAGERGFSTADPSQSPTLTGAPTQMGVLLGTAAYMSPEQARGKPVDKRADIWAFGCVFYEMLTGRRTFDGEDVANTLAFVLTKEVDWSALPALPVQLRRLLNRCLRRDPRQRLRDIGEARVDLEELLTGPLEERDIGPAADQPVTWWRTAVGGLVMLGFGAALAGVGVWRVVSPSDPLVQRFDIAPPEVEVRLSTGSGLAISPDGRLVAMVSGGTPQQLHLRSLDRLEVRTLEGLGNPRRPFFSPDGEWIGYLDGTTLKKVNTKGGPAVTICKIGGTGMHGASWAADDTIIFATNQAPGLFRVSAGGGDPEVLTSIDEQSGEVAHSHPEVLPGGDTLLFTTFSGGTGIANAQIVLLDLESGQRTVVVRGGIQSRYVPSGHIVYTTGGELWAVSFDAARRIVNGNPVRVLEDVHTSGALRASSYAVAREEGSLVYMPASTLAGRRRLAPGMLSSIPSASPIGSRSGLITQTRS